MRWTWWRTRLAFEWLRNRTPWRHKSNLSKERPPGWSQSRIGQFLEFMWSNAIATFANFNESKRVKDIDDLLAHFTENASCVKNKAAVSVGLPLLLTLRAHSAFRAAVSLAFAGAVLEAMASLRLCLETAGYAAMMQGNEPLSLIWLSRGDSDKCKSNARHAFRHSEVRRVLEERDKKLSEIYQNLYEYLIDGGAHPNERGFMESLQVQDLEDGGARLIQIYVQDDPKILERGVRAAGKVGVCALMTFEMMYPDEFRDLEISGKIPTVARGL